MQNTVSDHDLTCSDVPAILGWGQYSADAELWGLLARAAQTPPSSQTPDQRNAVAWLTSLQQAQDEQAADDAGMEYAKWAGLGVSQYQSVLNTDIANDFQLTYNPYTSGPPADPLLTFLSQTPEPYWNGENQNTPAVQWYNEGYCAYQSPNNRAEPLCRQPLQHGHRPTAMCDTVQASWAAAPTTPTLSDFQGWGTSKKHRQRPSKARLSTTQHMRSPWAPSSGAPWRERSGPG